MIRRRVAPLVFLGVAATSCVSAVPGSPKPLPGGDWILAELRGQATPTGAGGRIPALSFDSTTMRVSGFAGCNRIMGSYSVVGDSLRFGELAMTRMACEQGMELERALAEALRAATRYSISGDTLDLLRADARILRFTRLRADGAR